MFTPQRSGFDAMVGNPPWEVMKPISKEFFTEYEPLYRTYDKQAALRRQQELFDGVPGVKGRWDDYSAGFKALSNWVRSVSGPFDLSLARGKRDDELAAVWEKARSGRIGFANQPTPFCRQGGADLNSFKVFLEVAHHRLSAVGRLGFLVPSALYTDSGTRDLRELFLDRSTWEWLFSFENKKRIFAIHGSFKFAATIVDRRRTPSPLRAAFMIHDLGAWERAEPPVFEYDRSLIPLFSPRSKSLPEVRTQRDLEICRKIYDHSFRIGDNAPGWEITYAREFDMSNDSKLFPPKDKWEDRGFRHDVFGRWVSPNGRIALPFYQGRMVGQFDFSQKGWVSGRGRGAVWRLIRFAAKTFEPLYLMEAGIFAERVGAAHGVKVCFMDVTSATNTRTTIAVPVIAMPCGDKVPTLRIRGACLLQHLLLAAYMNSLVFDFTTRTRLGSTSLKWFIVSELPLPPNTAESWKRRLVLNSSRLSFIHRRFAPEWLKLAHCYAEVFGFHPLARPTTHEPRTTRQWKQWWAVTEVDRLRLRVEIDALCADLYGLDPDDFDWIVRDERKDPKGFWRVDKQLPFRERLTGLAAAAFRALKEGKWSAESAADLSDDEFFDLLGIPELTNTEAAKAKGLPGPLILKRDGCHVWKPENFPEDDPRHGWTWDDCRKDAVALLGSEEAVRKYVEGQPQDSLTPGPSAASGRGEEESFQLRNDPPKRKRRKGR
ncbi:MAG: hypothetical protein A2V98_24090 [Planctomycetes bacterium RBG_16_64_12]|nr:MAG: hypothetical protein A2V98_24090 [Planctomycetes bacterium RBG_16_64_12]